MSALFERGYSVIFRAWFGRIIRQYVECEVKLDKENGGGTLRGNYFNVNEYVL